MLKGFKVKCFIIFLFVVIITFLIFAIYKHNNTVVVNASPVTNKIVILDAGHGLPDERSFIFSTVQQNKK